VEEGRAAVAALEALPRADAARAMAAARAGVAAQLGGRYPSAARLRARVDAALAALGAGGPGGGSREGAGAGAGRIESAALEEALLRLGAVVPPAERTGLLARHAAGGGAGVDAAALEAMARDLLHGAGWRGDCDAARVRARAALCAHLRTGRDAEWGAVARGWLAAEDELAAPEGITDVAALDAVAAACGALTHSAPLERAAGLLAAAAELDVATAAPELRRLIGVVGRLAGSASLDAKRAWVAAERELEAWGYAARGPAGWRRGPLDALGALVARCGAMDGSPALAHARRALRAAAELPAATDPAAARALLADCAHLSGCRALAAAGSALRALRRLPDAPDAPALRAALAALDGSPLADCAAARAARHALALDAALPRARGEAALRAALHALAGRLPRSANAADAAQRCARVPRVPALAPRPPPAPPAPPADPGSVGSARFLLFPPALTPPPPPRARPAAGSPNSRARAPHKTSRASPRTARRSRARSRPSPSARSSTASTRRSASARL
jgi:hypothetical protein